MSSDVTDYESPLHTEHDDCHRGPRALQIQAIKHSGIKSAMIS